MYIARQLKEKNIAEYLLYMWQVEDLIRAHHMDLDELERNYLVKFQTEGDARKELVEWYGNLIVMMRTEGVQESGHLQINTNILLLLTDLHRQLLGSTKFPFYTAAYYKVLPYIVEVRGKGDRKPLELETCFDILYGVMLLRMQQKAVNEETAHAVADITKLLGMLSGYYKQDKVGELKFE